MPPFNYITVVASHPPSKQPTTLEEFSIAISISNGEVGFEYWRRWQVPVCALIIVVPAVISSVLIKRRLRSGHHLSHACLWVPCWRAMNPIWLLLYRLLAFISMARLLSRRVASIGLLAFYFYTQWTFTLVMVYFAIGTIISARGCWMNLEKPPTEAREKDKFRRNRHERVGGDLLKHFNEDENEEQAGFWGYVMHMVYQVSAGASILTDSVFWCVLVPMLSGKEFQLTLLLRLTHSVNVVFLIIDSALNNLPFQWFGLTYFASWTLFYITFQWIARARGFTRWAYPFLELATPWAPLWYLGLALFHIPCYSLYIIFTKAMVLGFSRLFPHTYTRLYKGTPQREKTA